MSNIKDIEDIKTLNLATKYGDISSSLLPENPYYIHEPEISRRMNIIVEPNEIPVAVHKSSNQIDVKILREYTNDFILANPSTEIEFRQVNRTLSKKYHILFKKMDIYSMYCTICKEKDLIVDTKIRNLLQTKAHRSESGVTVYAVFTHPMWRSGTDGKQRTFSCAYDCTYCPNMPGQPRSYVPGEPGNDRAYSLEYDTIKQIHTRATAYMAQGHSGDKAEVIVLGGTWHSYPLEYRREFITLLYYAFNTIHENRNRKMLSMEEEININETSKCHVIGLTIETRPDQINTKELIELRRIGCTRVQLGIQHTNDRILTRIKRRCTANDGIRAIKNLKNAGFKVDIHLMPDLPKPFTEEFVKKNIHRLNSKQLIYEVSDIDWSFDSINADNIMMNTVFHGTEYCPDQVKIYPCEVMDWTEIKNDFDKGCHVPYGTNDEKASSNPLIELLINVKSNFPQYCRINRVIRDIPDNYVLGGFKDSGGRQRIERIMNSRGLTCKCIRCREIKKQKIILPLHLDTIHYKASDGDEYFLQYVTDDNKLIGFLRLRISNDSGIFTNKKRTNVVFDELTDCAMIRELHVYGETVNVSNKNTNSDRSQQHTGIGKKLVADACNLARTHGYHKISVISGVGVKPYYRKLGFYDGMYFLLKDIYE